MTTNASMLNKLGYEGQPIFEMKVVITFHFLSCLHNIIHAIHRLDCKSNQIVCNITTSTAVVTLLFHYPNHPRKYESSKSICIKTMVICKIRKNTQKSTLLDVFCCNFGTRPKKSEIFVFPEYLHMY